jgi:hypothetical protein
MENEAKVIDFAVGIADNDEQKVVLEHHSSFPRRLPVNPLPVVQQSIKSTDQPTTELAGEPTSLYKYFDQFGVLIYIGITANGILRNRQHNSDKAWWPYVTRQEVEHLPSRDAALERERDLIEAFMPPFNRQHNPKHAQHRSVYPVVRSEMENTNIGGLVHSRQKMLTFACDRIDGNRAFLSTGFADAAVARHMVFTKEPKVVVFDNQNSRIGKVVSGVVVNGRFSIVVSLDNEKEIQSIRGAVGRVIAASLKKPVVLKLKNVCAAVTWDLAGVQEAGVYVPPKPPAWTAFTFENMRGKHVGGWDVITHIGNGEWKVTREINGEVVTGTIRLDWLGRLVPEMRG